MNKMEFVDRSLKQMEENVHAVQAAAVPGLTKWGKDKLEELEGRFAKFSKQVL